ncbi:hypothetical protein K470DRAFT_145200 [Piedraia hortae CBS 480.64]|uniref:Uncharacterized protein n=1 Tax=Piedraia hortae CBS 480.64 TaxID=1314780 RepID=A0A6A7BSB7_9PEZI|nr:hypothetical protein K470DRAFT_145200 [Piedraia hortae CBS 480.64]
MNDKLVAQGMLAFAAIRKSRNYHVYIMFRDICLATGLFNTLMLRNAIWKFHAGSPDSCCGGLEERSTKMLDVQEITS